MNQLDNENVADEHHGKLNKKESKNTLGMNQIEFSGHLATANHALKNLVFEPSCPLDADNII